MSRDISKDTELLKSIKKGDIPIREEFVSLTALNQWAPHDSSPRGVMHLMQTSQPFVLENPEKRIIPSGLEKQLADNTYKVIVEKDLIVRAVISSDPDIKDISKIPMITILGYCPETNEVDGYDIPLNLCLQQSYGFRYRRNIELLSSLCVGDTIPAGTVLADSPGVVDGEYAWGINANVLLGTDPASGQDGIVVFEQLIDKMTYKVFVSGSLEWGAESFPINLYGDVNKYQAFPNVGDPIGPDNVFGVIRENNKRLAPATTSINDTRTFNPHFDKAYYVKPDEVLRDEHDVIHSSEVISLKVIHSPKNKRVPLYNQEQTEYLHGKSMQYSKAIVNAYEAIKKAGYRDNRVAPKMHRKIKEALDFKNQYDERIAFKFRNDPIDLYRIEFTIEYTCKPGIGSKISDSHGEILI